MDGASVSKMLAEKWKAMDEGEKQQYYQESERLKNLHQLQHPFYKYSPKPRKLGMKKSVAKTMPFVASAAPLPPVMATSTASPMTSAPPFPVTAAIGSSSTTPAPTIMGPSDFLQVQNTLMKSVSMATTPTATMTTSSDSPPTLSIPEDPDNPVTLPPIVELE